jgi:hypothetical protein
MSSYMYYITFVLLIALLVAKPVLNYFKGRPFSYILNIYLIGILLNICVIGYLLLIFKNVSPRDGPEGPKGTSGKKGFIGNSDVCGGGCDEKVETLGSNIIKERKNKEVFIKTPTLPSNITNNNIL